MIENSKREQSFELLRVILMLLIIAHHLGIHGGVINAENIVIRRYGMIIASWGQVAVATFYMLYGYFAIKGSFRIKRLIDLWLCMVEYGVLALLLSGFLGVRTLIPVLLPVSSRQYNFMTMYFIMALIFPLMADSLRNKSKQFYMIIFIVGLILFGVGGSIDDLSYISNSPALPLYYGVIGAGIRLYKEDFSEKIGRRKDLSNVVVGIPVLFFVCSIVSILYKDGIFWSKVIGTSSMITVLTATSLLIIFGNLKINGNWQTVSACAFGVFIIHENPFAREYIWNQLMVQQKMFGFGFGIYILLSIGCILLIYIIASLVEGLRRIMASKLYKVINSYIEIDKKLNCIDMIMNQRIG